MNVKKLSVIAAACLVVGCVQQAKLVSTTPFNPADTSWAMRDGPNTVTGFAVLRTVGGEARTCAALLVRLIPDSPLARERMVGLYGSRTQGTAPATAPTYDISKTDTAYIASVRETRCDGQGNFVFERVPDGTWYVTAAVVWSVGGRLEGGTMMKRVDVAGGRTVKVSLP